MKKHPGDSKMNGRKIKVLLVSDQPSVLNEMRAHLLLKEHVKVVGQSLDGVDAVQKAKKLQPEIVLLDLGLSRMSGIDALRRISGECPETKLIAYTMHGREDALIVAFDGYVLRNSSLNTLERAFKSGEECEIFADSAISSNNRPRDDETGELQQKDMRIGPRQHAGYGLTKRGRRILKMLADGMVLKQISARLSVPTNTMIPHLKHIYQKLGVNTRGAVVAKTLKENLV